nr:CoA-binding protein [candidate division Zixibacteria bacterium]
MPVYGPEGNGWKNPSAEKIRELLEKARTVAVVGLSSRLGRPSLGVAQYLQTRGYRIIPVNPREETILGEKSYPDLKSIPDKIDIVDVFRRSREAYDIVEQAIEIGVGAVWLQESVVSPEAFKKGDEAGLIMVMDRCMYKEHRHLLPG